MGLVLGSMVIGFVNGWNEPIIAMESDSVQTGNRGLMTPFLVICLVIPLVVVALLLPNKLHRRIQFKVMAIDQRSAETAPNS